MHFRALVPLVFVLLGLAHATPIDRLCEYLRVRTDHGQPGGPDYNGAAAFLHQVIGTLLPAASIRTLTYVAGKPIVLATLTGTDPKLPSLLLNSHTDVVPANASAWVAGEPFAPAVGKRIYARGAQDMKSVGMQYIEALGQLMADGWKPLRTVHISFVPDEEIGGVDGMGELVKAAEWKELGVGMALDEGSPHADQRFNVYVGERQTWWFYATVSGAPGHGATFPRTTATQVAHGILANALAYRDKQRAKLDAGVPIGDIVGLNVAFFESGVPDANYPSGYISNMIPDMARVGFDIRVPPNVDPVAMDAEIRSWMMCGKELCTGVTWKFTNKVKIPFITNLDGDQWYAKAFFDGLAAAGIDKKQLDIGIFKAATDARFVRALGIPAIGFSPICGTPDLLHKHDEYIETDGYERGVRTYVQLIKSLADTAASSDEKTEL